MMASKWVAVVLLVASVAGDNADPDGGALRASLIDTITDSTLSLSEDTIQILMQELSSMPYTELQAVVASQYNDHRKRDSSINTGPGSGSGSSSGSVTRTAIMTTTPSSTFSSSHHVITPAPSIATTLAPTIAPSHNRGTPAPTSPSHHVVTPAPSIATTLAPTIAPSHNRGTPAPTMSTTIAPSTSTPSLSPSHHGDTPAPSTPTVPATLSTSVSQVDGTTRGPLPTNSDSGDSSKVSLGILIGAVLGAVALTIVATALLTAKFIKRKLKVSGRTANFESLYADRPIGSLGGGTKLIDLGSQDLAYAEDDDTALLGEL